MRPEIGVIALPDDFFYRPVFDDSRFDQAARDPPAEFDQRFVFGRAQSQRHFFPAAAHVAHRAPVRVAFEIVEHRRFALFVLAAIGDARPGWSADRPPF